MISLKLVRLSNKNFIKHHNIAILTFAFIYIIFGFICSLLFITKSNPLEDKIVLYKNFCEGDYISMNCETPESYDAKLLAEAKEFDGYLVGAIITYVNDEGETKKVTSYKVEKVASEVYKNDDDLTAIKTNAGEVLIMDTSGKIAELLTSLGYKARDYEPAVLFDDSLKAYEYSKQYEAKELFSDSLKDRKELEKKHERIQKVSMIAVAISILVFVIVIIFCIKYDKKEIMLYRMLGATKGNIFIIYSFWFIELFIPAIVAIIIGWGF